MVLGNPVSFHPDLPPALSGNQARFADNFRIDKSSRNRSVLHSLTSAKRKGGNNLLPDMDLGIIPKFYAMPLFCNESEGEPTN